MSLDSIAVEARAELGGNGEAQPGAAHVEVLPPLDEKAQRLTEAEGWSRLPYLFGRILAQAMPELAEVYTEAACLEWGHAVVPVARKYGWTLGGADMWVGLSAATWTLAEPTFKAIKRRRSENAERSTAAAAAPAGETEIKAQKFHPDGSPIE